MVDRRDDVEPDAPPPETVHAREADSAGGLGRWSRLRSLATILCGLLVLALLVLVIGQTE